jgi:cellulose synthase/poly-beta-1,6-N-acetylglucosamine synthase-like glycosyltransferase
VDYRNTPYFHVGRALDLTGKDRVLYRFFEMVPGICAWTTLILIVVFSKFTPILAAILVIVFDIYWLLKTFYLSLYLRHNWLRLRTHMKMDWTERLQVLKYDHVEHAIILPFYKESFEVVDKTLQAIAQSRYDLKKIHIVLAREARAGNEAALTANQVEEKYSNTFASFNTFVHPSGTIGEIAGKGSNIAFAGKKLSELMKSKGIVSSQVLVSAFDVDTVVYPEYFSCLTWHFITADKPLRSSFQPVPFYHNNLWQSPALSRVVAVSGTFWQMIQQERPERLATFSSHAVALSVLEEVGFWQTNMVSEDSRIFWNAFATYNGDYSVVPLSYPVSMDANCTETFWQTLVNIYKQQRRWGWGSENVPYILMMLVKHKSIPLSKRLYVALVQIEGFWSLATHPLIILLLGWLPLLLGGQAFNTTLIAYNLPQITAFLMNAAMFGLIVSAVISWSLLPKPEIQVGKFARLAMVLQWVLVPITMTIFSALPGLDAQTRLMLGKYMGFWVTPKHRTINEKTN